MQLLLLAGELGLSRGMTPTAAALIRALADGNAVNQELLGAAGAVVAVLDQLQVRLQWILPRHCPPRFDGDSCHSALVLGFCMLGVMPTCVEKYSHVSQQREPCFMSLRGGAAFPLHLQPEACQPDAKARNRCYS